MGEKSEPHRKKGSCRSPKPPSLSPGDQQPWHPDTGQAGLRKPLKAITGLRAACLFPGPKTTTTHTPKETHVISLWPEGQMDKWGLKGAVGRGNFSLILSPGCFFLQSGISPKGSWGPGQITHYTLHLDSLREKTLRVYESSWFARCIHTHELTDAVWHYDHFSYFTDEKMKVKTV